MNSKKYTTRTQLKGYGASQYQAKRITKNLTPTGKESRTYTYSLRDVINSIREYLERPRIKLHTRKVLKSILQALLIRLGNVVKVPFFRGTDHELSKLTKQLFDVMADADTHSAELKAMLATIRGKY